MQEYITLITQSGRWQRRVRRDDPLFSSLIPDLDELPDELPLSGSVAEIFEDEWKYYEMLEKAHREVMRHLTLLESGMARDKPMSFIPLTHCVLTYVANGGNIVAYSSISRLLRLLDVPSYLFPYIYVDKMISSRIAINHLRMVANQLRHVYPLYVTHSCALTSFTVNLVNEARDEGWSNYVLAQYHNAELVSIVSGRKPSMYDVDWESTLEVVCEDRVYVKDCISAILGRDVSIQSNLANLHIPLIGYVGGRERDWEIYYTLHDANTRRLYRSILSCYPDNVAPRCLGIGFVVTGEVLALDGTVPQIHLSAIHVVMKALFNNKNKIPMKHYSHFIQLCSMTIIGREGLRRMLLSLLHYLPYVTDKKELKRIDTFCTLVEKYLDENEQDECSDLLPQYDMIDEVIRRVNAGRTRNRSDIMIWFSD